MDTSVWQPLAETIAREGAWASMALLVVAASFWLVKWTLSESAKRDVENRLIVTQQMAVIDRQCQTLDSQSQALNKITDRIETMCKVVDTLERTCSRHAEIELSNHIKG